MITKVNKINLIFKRKDKKSTGVAPAPFNIKQPKNQNKINIPFLSY